MQYTSHFCSPLGRILLAADDVGLTGPGLRGRNILPAIWMRRMWIKNCRFLKPPNDGFRFISRAGSRISPCRFIVSAQIFKGRYGKFSAQSLWKDDDLWRDCRADRCEKEGRNGCLRRQLEARWGTTKSHSSSPVTGSSVRTAA